MEDILQLINQLFRESGLLTADGIGQEARRHCISSRQCWQNESEDRFPRGENAIASFPWIGSKYLENRMLLVGENLFDCGGVHAFEGLVTNAQEELRHGRYRVTFGNPRYHSFFWHRAAVYTTIWLNYWRGLTLPLDDQPECVATAFDSIAMTNQVKCSPASSPGVRSTPNPQMWDHCGKTILYREVNALGAKRILVLGISNNLRNLQQNLSIPTASENHRHSRNVITIKDSTSNREVLAVRHPATPGGNSKQIFSEVSSALATASFSRQL